jgi:hypothetical protein
MLDRDCIRIWMYGFTEQPKGSLDGPEGKLFSCFNAGILKIN